VVTFDLNRVRRTWRHFPKFLTDPRPGVRKHSRWQHKRRSYLGSSSNNSSYGCNVIPGVRARHAGDSLFSTVSKQESTIVDGQKKRSTYFVRNWSSARLR